MGTIANRFERIRLPQKNRRFLASEEIRLGTCASESCNGQSVNTPHRDQVKGVRLVSVEFFAAIP